MNLRKRTLIHLIVALALVMSFVPIAQPARIAQAVSTTVVISQVYGGGGNSGATFRNDFIELFNRGTSAVSLAGWSVQYASATSTSWAVTSLTGVMLQPGQYYLIQEAAGSGGTTPLPSPDASGSIAMSATAGKVAVANTTTALSGAAPSSPSIVDVVGFGTTASFFEGAGPTPAPSNTTAALRAGNGCADTDNNASDFSTGVPSPRNTASPLNPCGGGDVAPSVSSTTPANGATNVAVDANLSVTFSEAINVAGTWFSISCGSSLSHAATVSGGPTTFTLDPGVDFANGETCTVTVFAAQVTDQDTNDPPDNMVADSSWSFDTVSAATAAALVINEIDYDQPSTDTAEFVEVRNNDSVSVDLSSYSIEMINGNAGGATQYRLFALPVVNLAPGDYFVLCANNATVANCDLDVTPETDLIQNGAPDAVALLFNGSVVDTVSYEGNTGSPYTEGSGIGLEDPGTTSSVNLGISRLPDGVDTNQNNVDLSTRCITPGEANSTSNSACAGGDIPPTVASTNPTNGTTNVSTSGNIDINFSENVAVTGSWFSISCANSGAHTATVSGGPQNYTLNPDADFAFSESCTVTVFAANVADQDGTPDNMAANFVFSFTTGEVQLCGDPATFIHTIQGSGLTSPMSGTLNVVIEGVVVGDYQNTVTQFSGFYVQEEDADADADPLTSEGIFVFNSSVPVNAGDLVRVRGRVFEFSTSGVFLTELSPVTDVTVCSSGNSVTPSSVTLPVSSLTDWERYEGMLINILQDLTATENFTLGRFGEVSLSVNGRLHNPTNIVAPGAPAIAQQDLNNRSRILLDDGNNQQNIDPTIHPLGGLSAFNTLRSGYTVYGLNGVLEQRFGVYRVQPVGSISFDASTNPRTAAPAPVGGNLKVAALNVLNFFTTLDDGTPICGPTGGLDCRGANSAFEFTRQRDKIINAILAIDPDIAGLMEVQNDASATIQNLVDGLNDIAGAGTYAYINTGTIGTDAIKVAIIYKSASVTPVGSYAILDSSVNPLFIDTKNRPSLAQTFERNTTGAKLTVVVNHLKSKGSDCNDVGDTDAGDGQGNCNLTRNNAAIVLVNWLATDPTGSGDADFLVMGDMNSYAKEDPITTITNAGYVNLIASFVGADAYSYVFDGQSGYLDHALASPSLAAQATGVTEWHNNADEPTVLDYNVEFKTANQINTFYTSEPYRASDHDPVVVGLNLNAPPTVDAGGPYSAPEGGSVTLTASGSDPNGDSLTYAWDLDNNGSFETSGQSVSFSAASLDGPSSYTVKVKATDPLGLFAESTATVNVLNVAPTVNTPSISPEPSFKGSSVVASATFSDPGVNDAPFTCTVNYGDGSGNLPGTVSGNLCTGPAHAYSKIGSYTVAIHVTDKDNATGSNTVTHAVIFNFSGFFRPVDNPPALNVVKAGWIVPVRFSLNGYQGLKIFAAGYPQTRAITCNASAQEVNVDETIAAGRSLLLYNPFTGRYIYIWKTDRAWAGTCRQLVVKFIDGTFHYANFKFTK